MKGKFTPHLPKVGLTHGEIGQITEVGGSPELGLTGGSGLPSALSWIGHAVRGLETVRKIGY
jgi:hypothetical protein